jgi:DNA-binding NarL/FixJ family response regulator
VAQDSRPRLLLADDHPEILRAFQRLLAPLFEVVGLVSDGAAVLEAAMRLEPDVVVLDLGMPKLNGLEACAQLKAEHPKTKIVVVTATNDEEIRQAAFRNGASAFVLKQKAAADLCSVIQRALEGDKPCQK